MMPDLKSYDILLYRGNDFTSHLIQWGTNSPYNHVAVVLNPTTFLGVESNTGHYAGVRAIDIRKIDFSIVDIYRIKEGFTFDHVKCFSFLVSTLGAKYDYLGVFSLGLLKLISMCTMFKYKLFSSFQKTKDYFCSELLYEAFYHGGLDIVPEVDQAGITSPGDIANSSCLEKVTSKRGISRV